MSLPLFSIPTHKVAMWLIGTIRRMLNAIGLQRDPNLEAVLYVVIVAVVAVLIGWLIRKLILWTVQKSVYISHSPIGADLTRSHVFTKCSHIIPPLVLMSLVPFSLVYGTLLRSVVMKLLFVYLMLAITIAVNSVIDFVWVRYNVHENTRNLPLKGIANTMRGVVWIVTVIITVSMLFDKSPLSLLAGLGAFAAALMLIFKDSLLGLVSSIQLSQNDMVRIGDWITVPGTPANGIVLDLTLSTVKIRNFDNTIITCPPYRLVQESFQNWRGMQDAGARRVSYDLNVDNSTIRLLSAADVASLTAQFPELAPWVKDAQASPGGKLYTQGKQAVNGSMETNLGLFRALICAHIINNPQMSHTQQMLVRVQPPTPQGTTLNVYCFANTSNWTLYEAIISELMEYVVATAPAFGLRMFTPVTGHLADPTTQSSPSTK